MGEKLLTFIKSLRPQLSFDNITGEPQLQITYQTAHEKEYTLRGLFEFLDSQNEHIVIAIDEFQQIRDYPEKNMEALLRTYIQQLKNVHFIFSGSKKHIMTEMFSSAKRPFYRSSQMMHIDVIDEKVYYQFATKHLSAHGQYIGEETFHDLYTLVEGYTWNIQNLLNRLYQGGKQQIDYNTVLLTINQILQEELPSYQLICRLVTDRQLQVLRTVAKEGVVKEPGSNLFLQKYQL